MYLRMGLHDYVFICIFIFYFIVMPDIKYEKFNIRAGPCQ